MLKQLILQNRELDAPEAMSLMHDLQQALPAIIIMIIIIIIIIIIAIFINSSDKNYISYVTKLTI